MNNILATPLAKAKGYRQDFVEAASAQRAASTRLASIIERASKDPSVPWEDVVRLVVDDLKISPDQFRLIAKVSLSTISRWRSGDAEPHLMMRGYIGESLAKYICEQGA
ncbi:hypothetical protein V5279_03825 [Bradyrhizobium sp. 26S5]|uniref:hypothetical protein n=1 Tax=Bradyrhizobium sp. 26S5 TaxID=3139729 RepID=UPI0030CB2E75